jgi:gluconolactonase
VLAARYRGKRFNSPNDIVIDRQGRIYFSDPKYVGPEKMELDRFNVYRLDPDGALSVATSRIAKPNGVVLSPDQKTLYVAETDNGTDKADIVTDAKMGRMTLNALPIQDDGTLGEPRVIVDFKDQVGVDGMTVDTQGRIYAAVRSEKRHGIYVLTPEGKELAYIQTPALPTNACFGRGDEAQRLYVTAGGGLYRIRTNATGYHPAID